MGALEQLVWPLPARLAAVGFACALSAAAAGSVAYGFGYRYASSLGATALATLKSQHAEQAMSAESANRQQLMQQVIRANESEFRLFEAMTQHAQEQQQLQERIAMSRLITGLRLMQWFSLSLVACSLLAGCATTTPPLVCPPQEQAPLPPTLRKRPAPPPALTPNYWKAVSPPQTFLPTPKTTACGRATFWPSSTPCSIYGKRTDALWM